MLPYIVIQKSGGGNDEKSLCGSTALTYPQYRIFVWFAQSGSVSMNRIKDILDRVDTLLNNASVTSTTPYFSVFKDNSDSIIQVQGDGKIYYAGILNYQIITRS